MSNWIECYQEVSALWIHDGNPKRPHALLTSGKHSNGFFNSQLVISDEVLLGDAASDLVDLLVLRGVHIEKIDVVVGPQTGATKLAELIRQQIVSRTGHSCVDASPAKAEKDGEKTMVFNGKELALLPGKFVLLCEDVLTTGGSVNLAAKAVTAAGGIILPFLLVLVNRSEFAEVNGNEVIALIHRSMPTWTPEECPLCKLGSRAIRPKGENWALLNAAY